METNVMHIGDIFIYDIECYWDIVFLGKKILVLRLFRMCIVWEFDQ